MKVQQGFTIGDRAVTKVAEFEANGMAIFLDEIDDETHVYYFTSPEGVVLRTMKVEAGCGQNRPYLAVEWPAT